MLSLAKFRQIACLFFCLLIPLISPGQDQAQQDWARAKGIYADTTGPARTTQAVQFFVLRPHSNEHISTEHDFHSGDHFRFEFILKQEAYVCVLNRTVQSSIAGELHSPYGESERRPVAAGSWHVVLPANPSQPMLVPAGIPTVRKVHMNDEPGLEIVTVIISPTPIEVAKFLNRETPEEDARASALANLDNGLTAWSTNCDVEFAPVNGYGSGAKAIVPDEKESYVYAKDSREPFAFQVKLKHLP